MGILQIALTLLILVVLAVPLGKYIYKIISFEKSFVDPAFDRLDGFVYKLTGIKKDDGMNWKQYTAALLATNVLMGIILYFVLRLQSYSLLNPNSISQMEPSLSFNTAASFITNTNLQHYSGEWGASHLTQMVLTVFMFVAPASGLAAAAAFLRGIFGKSVQLGNFFVDMTRFITRLLLPLSVPVSILLAWQGVPQTLLGNSTITTLEGKLQNIAMGPVASFEAIKNLASNGGGFFGANSAHPFENPTALTNLVSIVSLGLISTALIFTVGHMLKNKKQAWVLFSAAFIMLAVSVGITYWAELQGNTAFEKAFAAKASAGSMAAGNMEGKETRFGIAQSSLFTAATTAFQVGAVNNMHDSLTPLGGMAAMWNMLLQTAFGGKGTGLMYMLMYAILTVFLCGLMVGRSPEIFGKKIEGREIKMVAITILAHPLLILIPTAIALLTGQAAAGTNNPGYHGFSQVLYEFTSAAANNGSGFEGLSDNTVFWNISTGITMLLGRYVPIVALMAAAGSFAGKKPVPANTGTFRTDNAVFGFMLIAVVLIIGALTFFPALVLGPVSEYLTSGL